MQKRLASFRLGLLLSTTVYATSGPPSSSMDDSFGEVNYEDQVILYKQGKQSVERFHKTRKKDKDQGADFFSNPQLDYHYSHAWVDDNLFQGDARNSTHTFSLSGDIGDSMFVGLTLENDLYEADTSLVSFDQQTNTGTLYWGVTANDQWSFALFYSLSQVDIERGNIFGSTLAQQGSKMAGGAIASFNTDLSDNMNFGLTASVASLNKSSVKDIFDDENTQAIVIGDLTIALNDEWSIAPFASAVTLLDRDPGAPDGAYGSVGCDSYWTISESWSAKLGYERLVADDSRDENRLNLGASYRF